MSRHFETLKEFTLIERLRSRIESDLRTLWSHPSDRLSIEIDKQLACLNKQEQEHPQFGTSRIDGFRIVVE